MEGQVTLSISVGEFSIRHNVVVVDCWDEGILGVDVLTCRGAQIDLAMGNVSLQGLEIPLKPEDSKECRRVSPAEGTKVRAGHRNLVKGRKVGHTRAEPWMVEPLTGTSGGKDL